MRMARRPVIPLILAELKREPDHWFKSLREITGENPVPAEHRVSGSRWTSKLGPGVDIHHEETALDGDVFGSIALYFEREESTGVGDSAGWKKSPIQCIVPPVAWWPSRRESRKETELCGTQKKKSHP